MKRVIVYVINTERDYYERDYQVTLPHGRKAAGGCKPRHGRGDKTAFLGRTILHTRKRRERSFSGLRPKSAQPNSPAPPSSSTPPCQCHRPVKKKRVARNSGALSCVYFLIMPVVYFGDPFRHAELRFYRLIDHVSFLQHPKSVFVIPKSLILEAIFFFFLVQSKQPPGLPFSDLQL